MEFNESVQIFNAIRNEDGRSDSDWQELYGDMLSYAFRYAQIRAEWMQKSQAERNAEDSSRTAAHEAFISSLKALARYAPKIGLDDTWAYICERDRKEIGDLACFIHCIAGLDMR